ncbi:MAG TPA: hypothetical protein VK509_07965 [Polyangiales bacterium]|nr:hypothetical protein [Polyangiales bacterium]
MRHLVRSSQGHVLALLSALLCSACSASRDTADAESPEPKNEVRGVARDERPQAGAASPVTTGAPDAGALPATRAGRPSLGDTPLPCELERVVATSCRGCHAREPGPLAPMALVSYEDLTAPAISDPSVSVYELAKRRVHDSAAPMPPPPSRRLTGDELTLLDSFFDAAPEADPGPGCDDGITLDPDMPVPDSGAPDDLGACYQVRAHDLEVAGDQTPFRVANGEFYSCFYFDVPWAGSSQAVTIRSLDTPRVHHWQLYHVIEPHEDGQIIRRASDCGYDLREALGVYSHSEEREQRMPEGVGLALPAPGGEHGLLLEIHYYNTGEETPDDTGVEICTAKTPREHVAGIAGLGPSFFVLPPGKETSVSSVCTPPGNEDIHVFRSFPHMHSWGVHMETAIARADGSSDVMLDVPFDFNNQVMVDTPVVVHPGDRLNTRCDYVNDSARTIYSGFSVDSEMCNHFVYAWPVGAISNGTVNGIPTFCAF